ncbi:metallopeptidase family protein [Candidatus Saccharibacteria bacterium]|nr:metallopeptidase family protein [Candidatus Saccharibacteria bacterium]
MLEVSDKEFEQMIADAMDELPEHYAQEMNNVAITWDDEPTPHQREQLKLRCDQTLFGLYEGIPQTHRGAGYNLVLPDKITIFKLPMLAAVSTMEELRGQVKHTLWHELAHHFGLEHHRIHEIERQRQSPFGDAATA